MEFILQNALYKIHERVKVRVKLSVEDKTVIITTFWTILSSISLTSYQYRELFDG